MTVGSGTIWLVIGLLGIGTFLLRFSFLGLVGDRRLPAWVLRHLRYTPVAFLPAIAAPLVLWPAATDGMPDPARLAAAGVTLAVGFLSKNVLLAIVAGLFALYGGLAVLPG
ncbi:MAG: AzlD domain-containing protein [Paracoccaceae bacterium]|nr:AzlD domain-containing protein [Paracoccaceae bacterium]